MKNRTIHKIAGLIMALAMILGNTIHTQAAPSAQTTSPTIYWGATLSKVPTSTDMAAGGVFNTYETRSKKKMAIIQWGQPWMMKDGTMGEFQTSYFNNVRNHGSIPMINWNSWRLGYGVTQPDFQLNDVYSGKYDTYIRRWATAAKTWGHPFFLRFDHEMNGWWFPWGEGKLSTGAVVNGNSAGDYVKAWRHVHDIFVSVGATNVTWVWAPNHVSTSTRLASLSSLYPGATYVNWTGLSAYNQYSTWLGMNSLLTGSSTTWLSNSYNQLLSLAPYKPIMLAEWGSIEAGDGGAKKAAWIKDALTVQIPTNFPKIKAVVYFNWDITGQSYPVESSQAAIDAWAAGISLAKYATNQYANMNTSPIPALVATTTTSGTSADSLAGDLPTLEATPTQVPATLEASPTQAPATLEATPTQVPATLEASPTPIPATLEPTSTQVPTETTETLTATADTYLDSADPNSHAGGTSTTLYVGASPDRKTLLKFDLTQLAGKTVSAVTLKFKTSADASAGSVDSMNIKLVTDVRWKEKSVSYANPVAVSETLLGIVPANSTPDTWYEIVLDPNFIQQNLGGKVSVAMETTSSDELQLYSSETTDQPQLIIVYK
jgi:hypothetical protein